MAFESHQSPASMVNRGRDTQVWSEEDIERFTELIFPNTPDTKKLSVAERVAGGG